MNTTADKIIEVEVTEADLEEMRNEGVGESDLPAIGIKRYRSARHRIKDKSKITLLIDSEILEHFEKKERETFQSRINEELRRIMERDRAEESINKEKIAA